MRALGSNLYGPSVLTRRGYLWPRSVPQGRGGAMFLPAPQGGPEAGGHACLQTGPRVQEGAPTARRGLTAGLSTFLPHHFAVLRSKVVAGRTDYNYGRKHPHEKRRPATLMCHHGACPRRRKEVMSPWTCKKKTKPGGGHLIGATRIGFQPQNERRAR